MVGSLSSEDKYPKYERIHTIEREKDARRKVTTAMAGRVDVGRPCPYSRPVVDN